MKPLNEQKMFACWELLSILDCSEKHRIPHLVFAVWGYLEAIAQDLSHNLPAIPSSLSHLTLQS